MEMSKVYEKNQIKDDLKSNYMALLACILNNNLSSSSSLRLLGVLSKSDTEFESRGNTSQKDSNKSYKKVKVIDILTNKEFIFNSIHEAEEYTGIKKDNIYVYIPRNIAGKRRYKFSYYDSIN